MKLLTKIMGTLLIVGGIVGGIWFDIVILLVGGIKQIVAGLSAEPWNGSDIGWGVVSIMGFGLGSAVAVGIVMGGIALAAYGSIRRPKRRGSLV